MSPLQSVVDQVQFHKIKLCYRVEPLTHFSLLHVLNADNTTKHYKHHKNQALLANSVFL